MKNCILIFLVVLSTNIFAQMPDWAWIKNVRGSDRIIDIATDDNGNIFAVGTYSNRIFADNEIDYPAFRSRIVGIFLVKYTADGTQQWIKTVKANKHIPDVKLCMNTNQNPVIAFFTYGDTIDYLDTVLYYSQLDTFRHTYTNYLNILEYSSNNGKINSMKLFDASPTGTKSINSINIDKSGNYLLTGKAYGTRFGPYVCTNDMNIKLDKNFNFIWNYPFIYSKKQCFDRLYQSYDFVRCDTICEYHDQHINYRDAASFINKFNSTTGIAERIHSIKGGPYCSFSSISFNKNNLLDIVIENSTNSILDDSIQIDSSTFRRLNFYNNSALLAEFDANNKINKKCILIGEINYSQYLLKNETLKNYYNYFETYNSAPAPLYIGDDSIITNFGKINIISLDDNLKYISNKYIQSKSSGINFSGGSSNSTGPFYFKRMILDKNENIIIHFDYRDTVITDNGLMLLPYIRNQWSSFIAKLGNNTTSINDFDKTNNTLKVYPNPATQQVTIEIPTGINIKHISINNILGEEIKSYENNSQSTELIIDIQSLASGNYFIVLTDSQGKNYNARFLKMGD
jgi:hypothetical protein